MADRRVKPEVVVVVGLADQDGVGELGGAGVAEQVAVVGDEPVSGGGSVGAAVALAGAAGLGVQDEAFQGGRGALGVAGLEDAGPGVEHEPGERAAAQHVAQVALLHMLAGA